MNPSNCWQIFLSNILMQSFFVFCFVFCPFLADFFCLEDFLSVCLSFLPCRAVVGQLCGHSWTSLDTTGFCYGSPDGCSGDTQDVSWLHRRCYQWLPAVCLASVCLGWSVYLLTCPIVCLIDSPCYKLIPPFVSDGRFLCLLFFPISLSILSF